MPKGLKRDGTSNGGNIKGSGAKPKYNEKTETVAFRCPISKIESLKVIVKEKLKEWECGIKVKD